jgi:hypothetical protein
MSITQSQFWNTEYANFDATTSEAKKILNSIELTEENKNTLILVGFEKVSNNTEYATLYEAKENQYRYTPSIITFEEYKMSQKPDNFLDEIRARLAQLN